MTTAEAAEITHATKQRIIEKMANETTYTTSEVVELVNVPRRSVTRYLHALTDSGHVQKRKPNESLILWSLQ